MTTTVRKIANACFAVSLLAIGCGGRSVDGSENGSDTDPGSGADPTDTASTCADICRRAVDLCFPGGATNQCVSDCDTMRSKYKGCDGLDTFLRCRMKAQVTCATNEVIFEGCTTELNQVVRCHS